MFLSQGWVQIVSTLRMDTKGGKQRSNCADTEGILRIIQSIPSPKVRLNFKRWLAKVGRDYAIFTNEIYRTGFGVSVGRI